MNTGNLIIDLFPGLIDKIYLSQDEIFEKHFLIKCFFYFAHITLLRASCCFFKMNISA
jgi:hypothetical protein